MFWKMLDGVECGLFSGKVERHGRGVGVKFRRRAGQ